MLDDVIRSLLEATEFLTIVTSGEQGPHVVGNWGHYLRVLGVEDDTTVLPAGRYHQTEANLRKESRVQVMIASTKVGATTARPRPSPIDLH